jgi:hypothetical protein
VLVKELKAILERCNDEEEIKLVQEFGRDFKEFELHRLRGVEYDNNIVWFTIKED